MAAVAVVPDLFNDLMGFAARTGATASDNTPLLENLV
jgi:hypothetical protein